jgi:CHAD domain-containing protein
LEKYIKYCLGDETSSGNIPEALKKDIQAAYKFVEHHSQAWDLCYFDTFDWRLFSRKLCLKYDGSQYELRSLDQDELVARLPWQRRKPAKFCRQFPDGFFKDLIISSTDIRALIPVAELKSRFKKIDILNSDKKIVVRMGLEQIETFDASGEKIVFPETLQIFPLKGYDKECKDIISIIKNSGITSDKSGHVLLRVLELRGDSPAEYTSKPDLPLLKTMTAGEAVREIFLKLLEVIKQNEEGVIQDTDSEFLHDFRVSLRRTRAALAQLKNCLPAKAVVYFREEFGRIARRSNRTRDLDVYLLREEEYRSMLPASLGAGVDNFFRILKSQRGKEFRKLKSFLHSEEYRKTLVEWEHFLNDKSNFSKGKKAMLPVMEISGNLIYQRFLKMIAKGEIISNESPDEELHALRIEGKKLRYIVEFFSSLYPGREMSTLISQLKKLQDNLGNFNDLSVQLGNLHERLENLSGGKHNLRITSAALGGLITVLNGESKKIRLEFEDTFSKFNAKKNRELFEKLFK